MPAAKPRPDAHEGRFPSSTVRSGTCSVGAQRGVEGCVGWGAGGVGGGAAAGGEEPGWGSVNAGSGVASAGCGEGGEGPGEGGALAPSVGFSPRASRL